MSEETPPIGRVSPFTGLPIIPKGPPQPTTRCGEPTPAALLQAVTQFNAGRYWEAHETLEEIWRQEADPVRSLYQGLLLVGVGLHHLVRGNYHGASTKLEAGLARLFPYMPICQGVEVARLMDEARDCLTALQELGPEGIAALARTSLPQITLTFAEGATANDHR